jgi:hypothetical protein
VVAIEDQRVEAQRPQAPQAVSAAVSRARATLYRRRSGRTARRYRRLRHPS